jgi:hypothetical protein
MIGSTKVCICEKVFFIIMNAWVEKIVLHRTIGMYEMSPKKYVQNYECTPPNHFAVMTSGMTRIACSLETMYSL